MLPVGHILNKRYKIQKHIASGGFGNTYAAENLFDNSVVAVKEFFMKGINEYDQNFMVFVKDKDSEELFYGQRNKFIREAQTLACLNNSHIVRVFDSFNENNTAYYVMEFLKGDTLAQIIENNKMPIEEHAATNLLVQALDALMEIHKKNIIHLDIKPANIIVDQKGTVKIIDFGASKMRSTSTETIATYTPAYAPIELQQQQLEQLGPWTDIYSLGATFYFLLMAKKPPLAADIINLKDKAFVFNNNISDRAKKLIKWMMQPAIANRPKNVIQIFDFLENGIMPDYAADNTITPQSNNGTVYPQNMPQTNSYVNPSPYNPSFPQQNGRNTGFNNREGDNRKSSNGCIWTAVVLLIVIISTAFILWKTGVIKLGSDLNSVDSVKSNQPIIYDYMAEQELKLFEQLVNICNQTESELTNVQDLEELESLQDDFKHKIIDKMNEEQFQGVDLSDEHNDIINAHKDTLDKKFSEKKEQIQAEIERAEEERRLQEEEEARIREDYVQDSIRNAEEELQEQNQQDDGFSTGSTVDMDDYN